jgi:hypothetical protein
MLALCVACASTISAQTAVRVRADNDAFNFWQPPWARPDEEYSSGVRASVDYDGPAFFWKGGNSARRECSGAQEGCLEHTWSLGQNIFTAARTAANPVAAPGSRPNAGVLWLQDVQRISRADRLDEITLAAGVTGEPSLASPMQSLFHGLAPAFNRPVDWSRQVPFEPVANIAYDQHRRANLGIVEVSPHAGASLGNLLTEARLGIGARGGYNLSHPWLRSATRQRVELTILGDATLRAVAWNTALSGTMFRSSDRVTLRPLVAELQAGVMARFRSASVSYVVHQTGAEYSTHRSVHQWSALEVAWRFAQ